MMMIRPWSGARAEAQRRLLSKRGAMKNLVRQNTHAQEAIDWLMAQCLTPKDDEAPPRCELARQSLGRREAKCSACKWEAKEDPLTDEIGSLIKRAAFKHTHTCPYRVIASHLVANLVVGPEAFRARRTGKKRVDPVTELKKARTHVLAVLGACGLSPEDIAGLRHAADERYAALYAVRVAEQELANALKFFDRPLDSKRRLFPRGRTGRLHSQALARALVRAWSVLTGRLPAKNNAKFHALLTAAGRTVFGSAFKEPNWESATKRALEQIRPGRLKGM